MNIATAPKPPQRMTGPPSANPDLRVYSSDVPSPPPGRAYPQSWLPMSTEPSYGWSQGSAHPYPPPFLALPHPSASGLHSLPYPTVEVSYHSNMCGGVSLRPSARGSIEPLLSKLGEQHQGSMIARDSSSFILNTPRTLARLALRLQCVSEQCALLLTFTGGTCKALVP